MNSYELFGSQFPVCLTFDDVLLLPGYADFLPHEVELSTRLARDLHLKVPIVSAAMDTVTESKMAIALARRGGLGIVHRNMTIEAQAREVTRVKEEPVGEAAATTASLDRKGRFVVGAAIGIGQARERAQAVLQAGADVLVIDTAHGHSKNVIETLRDIKRLLPDVPLIAGNIATDEAANDLIRAGADALKVGIGPGSICTTRVVTGVGVPQISAIRAVSQVARAAGIPVIADGGIKYSGDITKAIGAGADVVMLGGLLARTSESPGEEIVTDRGSFKAYRGMGSLGALQHQTNDRYQKNEGGPLIPEGVEAMVPLTGSVTDLLEQLVGGLRNGMGYCGLRTIEDLKTRARFILASSAGALEGHPHGVVLTREAPNYAKRVG